MSFWNCLPRLRLSHSGASSQPDRMSGRAKETATNDESNLVSQRTTKKSKGETGEPSFSGHRIWDSRLQTGISLRACTRHQRDTRRLTCLMTSHNCNTRCGFHRPRGGPQTRTPHPRGPDHCCFSQQERIGCWKARSDTRCAGCQVAVFGQCRSTLRITTISGTC